MQIDDQSSNCYLFNEQKWQQLNEQQTVIYAVVIETFPAFFSMRLILIDHDRGTIATFVVNLFNYSPMRRLNSVAECYFKPQNFWLEAFVVLDDVSFVSNMQFHYCSQISIPLNIYVYVLQPAF